MAKHGDLEQPLKTIEVIALDELDEAFAEDDKKGALRALRRMNDVLDDARDQISDYQQLYRKMEQLVEEYTSDVRRM